MKSRLVIGLVGEPSGGKDTAAHYLAEKYAFVHISTGDLIRDYVKQNNLGTITRTNLKTVAIHLREQFGSDYLATQALGLHSSDNVVISGLRTTAEVRALQEQGAVIVAVSSDERTRYDRAQARGRVGDNLSFDEFKSQEAAERRNDDPNTQSVDSVLALADEHIYNNKQVDSLYADLDVIMMRLQIK